MQGWKKGVLLGLFSSLLWEQNTVEASIGTKGMDVKTYMNYNLQAAATAEAAPWAEQQIVPSGKEQQVPLIDWSKYLPPAEKAKAVDVKSSLQAAGKGAGGEEAGVGSRRVLMQEHQQLVALPRGSSQQELSSRGEAVATLAPPAPSQDTVQKQDAARQSTVSAAVSNAAPTLMQSSGVSSTIGNRAASVALKYLGVPYRYGGTTPGGFDCSGFTQYVYRQLGIDLPRTTYQQIGVGVPVAKANLRPGDLLFFSCNGQATSHSGMYVGNGKFVHADLNRGVVVADLDSSYWSAVYQAAVRIS